MSRRQNYEIPGVDHGPTPIPMAARIGNAFHSSGIIGKDPATNTLPEDGLRQVEFAFANAQTLLNIAAIELDQVLYVEVVLADNDLRGEVNKFWTLWYPDEGDRPARHTKIRDLPSGMKVQLHLQAQLDVSNG